MAGDNLSVLLGRYEFALASYSHAVMMLGAAYTEAAFVCAQENVQRTRNDCDDARRQLISWLRPPSSN